LPYISQNFINDLPNQIDIVDLISKRLTLKKVGGSYRAPCPFHGGKNPKIWCNYVYMYILYCSIFLWKLIDRIFFKEIFKTRVVSQRIPPFSPNSTVLHAIISKQDIHIC
jgi:hypothetical protein